MPDRPFFRNVVGPQFDGWSVLEFYSFRYRHSPPGHWRSWIDEGRVHRNGVRAAADDMLATGDVLLFYREERPEPPVERSYHVIHEDEHVIVADKPGGLPVMPSGAFFRHTLLHMLRAEREGEAVHPAHRIDIETSGLVIFTKSKEAARLLAGAFRENRVGKEYRALLCGHLDRRITADVPTGRIHDTARRFTYGVTETGKEARTVFSPLAHLPGRSLTLVEAVPLTGRTHQIRIHAAHIGHPVLGDSLYGGGRRFEPPSEARLALHSAAITFPHPRGEKQFRSEPPDWLIPP